MVTDDPAAAVKLNALEIAFSDPISQRAVSEIFPVQVAPGAESQFQLFFRPRATKTTGFDRLFLESPTNARFISALLNGEPIEVATESVKSGFQLTFPRPLGDDDLVELHFTAQIFQQSTPFALFIQDSRIADTSRQRVDSGDATDQVISSTNIVSLPVARDLLLNVVFNTTVLTPNGDGINDEITVLADVINILEPRLLRLRLYNLAGQLFAEQSQTVAAGTQHLAWDGRDQNGQWVAPGLYLLELYIEGDARQQRVQRAVSIVY